MEKIVLVDNEFITVDYSPVKAQITHVIHQPVSGLPFRSALDLGTQTLIDNKAYKWLSDDRQNGPLSDEDRVWGFTDWNLRTIDGGWKYWALVVPTEVMDAGTLSPTIIDLAAKGLRVMVFDNPKDAQKWLDQF